jgi:hypothetical protein
MLWIAKDHPGGIRNHDIRFGEQGVYPDSTEAGIDASCSFFSVKFVFYNIDSTLKYISDWCYGKMYTGR